MNSKQILDELASTTKRNEKIAILKKEENNELLKRVCLAALDPYTQYYIRQIPDYGSPTEPSRSLSDALDSLSKLSTRSVTGNAAIAYLGELLGSLDPDDAYVIERIIAKDLRCGVQGATVNKIWPKLIPTYPCLLGRNLDDKTIKFIEWPAYCQLKLDGMRVNIHVDENGGVMVKGRSGRPIELYGELDEAFNFLAEDHNLEPVVFDGELVVLENDGTIMARKKGNGILNKAIRGKISKNEAERVRVHLWDLIPREDFKNKYSDEPYKLRFETLQACINQTPNEKYTTVDTHEVNSFDECQELFEKALQEGQEGVMLKNMNSPWEDKRSKHLIKLKAELDCDLEVIDWVEGTGKYKGMLGALICRSSDGKVEVHVGSGFNDKDREIIKPEDIIGKIVTIKYNERIQSKGKDRENQDSLFLPRFVTVRHDKTNPDPETHIK